MMAFIMLRSRIAALRLANEPHRLRRLTRRNWGNGMNGVVTGGWNFVVAAYSVTGLVLLIYGVTIITRLRDEISRAAKER
jgi:hypothetical protein